MSTEGCTNQARSRNCLSVNKSVHSDLGIKAELGIIYLLSNNVAQLVQSRLCCYSKSILLLHISQSIGRSVSQQLNQGSQFISPSMSHLVSQSVTHSACQPVSYIQLVNKAGIQQVSHSVSQLETISQSVSQSVKKLSHLASH